MADSGISDQLIKLHSTHSWIRCVLSFSVSYFVVCYFWREHLIPLNYSIMWHSLSNWWRKVSNLLLIITA